MVRDGDGWREVSWDEAFDLVATRLREVRERTAATRSPSYQGNPTAHNLGLLTCGQLLFRALGTHNLYSATLARSAAAHARGATSCSATSC